jgi:hypothetical protein
VTGGSRHCRELGVRGIELFRHFRTCERRPRPFPARDRVFSLLIRKGISVSTGTSLLIGQAPSSGCSYGNTKPAPDSLPPVSGSQFATSGAGTSAFGASGASSFSATSMDGTFGLNSGRRQIARNRASGNDQIVGLGGNCDQRNCVPFAGDCEHSEVCEGACEPEDSISES